jgi:hypothetical protein
MASLSIYSVDRKIMIQSYMLHLGTLTAHEISARNFLLGSDRQSRVRKLGQMADRISRIVKTK